MLTSGGGAGGCGRAAKRLVCALLVLSISAGASAGRPDTVPVGAGLGTAVEAPPVDQAPVGVFVLEELLAGARGGDLADRIRQQLDAEAQNLGFTAAALGSSDVELPDNAGATAVFVLEQLAAEIRGKDLALQDRGT